METGNIFKGIPDIELEQDWSVGLGARYVTNIKLKTIFVVLRIFQGKPESVILLDFECTINPQNLNKIVSRFSENRKSILEIFAGEFHISNFNKIGQYI